MAQPLFTEWSANPKIKKGERLNYRSLILHLAPHMSAGIEKFNVCPMASAGCIASCLNTAGRGGWFKVGENTNPVQESRRRKTRQFFEDNQGFMTLLAREIACAIRRETKKGHIVAVRLNGTSDIKWENISVTHKGVKYRNLMTAFPEIQFYDYTKYPNRNPGLSNYHLTFSRSENNHEIALKELAQGRNVAVVFSDANFPEYWNGYPVHSGENHDLRFLDPSGFDMGFVIALKAKGRAKKDTSGFVVQNIIKGE